MRIGLIGAGRMGGGIAKNLLEKGYPVVIHKRNLMNLDDTAAALKQSGAELTDDLKSVFRSVELLLLCLPSSVEVEEVMIGPSGLIEMEDASVRRVVDFSTARPSSTRIIQAQLLGKGVAFLDAPMTGGPLQADAGEVNLAVGGDRETFEELKPVLESIAKNIVYSGPPGAGNSLKLINNFLGILSRSMASFASVLVDKLDIPQQKLYDFISVSGGYSRAFEKQMGWIMDGKFPAGFALKLGLKDILYTQELANSEDQSLKILDDFVDLLTEAADAGFAEHDVGAVYQFLKKGS